MSFDSGVGDLNDGELEKFLNVEKVKTQFHEQVSNLFFFFYFIFSMKFSLASEICYERLCIFW